MNHLNGEIAIGAPMSVARYENATRICQNCCGVAARIFGNHRPFLSFAKSFGCFITEPCTCYVCEQPTSCFIVKKIP